MQDRVVIFGPVVLFSGSANSTASVKFIPDDPCCHGNKIWDRIGNKSGCVGAIFVILAFNRFLGSSYRMMSRELKLEGQEVMAETQCRVWV